MEQIKNRKPLYIFLAVLLSFIVWFYANGDTEVVISVENVPIEFLNEETSLAEKGLMRVDTETPTVDLKLKMSRNTVFKLNTADIRAIADLGTVSAPGAQSISYVLMYPTNISTSDIKLESPTVRTVSVRIGELSRRTVDVRCKVVGSVEEGYIAGTVSLQPGTLEIRGQQEDIIRVSYAQVSLDVDHATSTIVTLLPYELYDFNDQVIHSELIHPAADEIQVMLPVMTVKEVPLEVEFIEGPGAQLANTEWKLSADSVTLSGDAAQLADIEKITLGTIDLRNPSLHDHFVYSLNIPQGVENLSGITEVTLDIAFRDIASVNLNASSFTCENLPAKRTAEVVTTTLPVTLMGTKEAIESVSEENIVVTADLSEVSDAEGTYTVPASVSVRHSDDVGAVGEYQVTVHLSAAEKES